MIKVGFCVSYDWFLLRKSIPRIYAAADKICLSIDKNRISWNGTAYEFNENEFKNWLSSIDTEKKIDLYEDDFALPGNSAMQNDSRQRNLMAARLGKGGWHIQIDSDEYFLNFDQFISALKKINPNPSGDEKPLNVCPLLIPLIKKTARGYLFVDFKNRIPEYAPFATNVPDYHQARRNGHFNIIVPQYVIHETWARSENELKYKISNWGHATEEFARQEVRESYLNLWRSLDEFNYKYIHDFHPGVASAWPSLGFSKGGSIEEFIANFVVPSLTVSAFSLRLRNSRNVARIKQLVNKVFR